MTTFKKAVSWAYHGETEEEIRNDLGYVGDLTPVYEAANLLKILGADHDTVNEWSTAPESDVFLTTLPIRLTSTTAN